MRREEKNNMFSPIFLLRLYASLIRGKELREKMDIWYKFPRYLTCWINKRIFASSLQPTAISNVYNNGNTTLLLYYVISHSM